MKTMKTHLKQRMPVMNWGTTSGLQILQQPIKLCSDAYLKRSHPWFLPNQATIVQGRLHIDTQAGQGRHGLAIGAQHNVGILRASGSKPPVGLHSHSSHIPTKVSRKSVNLSHLGDNMR